MIEFRKFLKKANKQPHVIEDLINRVTKFREFLITNDTHELYSAECDDIYDFHKFLLDSNQKPNNYLRAISLYYRYRKHNDLAEYASKLRESEISKTRRKFKIASIYNASKEFVNILKQNGIIYNSDLIEAAKTPELRNKLSKKLNLSEKEIFYYAKIADLSRLSAVKDIRAKLYCDAGFDKIEKIAKTTPEDFRSMIADFIVKNQLDFSPPTPKEALNTVENAGKLKSKVK